MWALLPWAGRENEAARAGWGGMVCSFQFPGTSAEGLWPARQHADRSVLLLPSLGLLCLNVTNVFIFMTVSCPVQGHKVLNAGHPSPPLSPPNPFHHPKPKLICIKYNSAPPTLPAPGLPCGSVTLAAVEMPVHGPHGTCAVSFVEHHVLGVHPSWRASPFCSF